MRFACVGRVSTRALCMYGHEEVPGGALVPVVVWCMSHGRAPLLHFPALHAVFVVCCCLPPRCERHGDPHWQAGTVRCWRWHRSTPCASRHGAFDCMGIGCCYCVLLRFEALGSCTHTLCRVFCPLVSFGLLLVVVTQLDCGTDNQVRGGCSVVWVCTSRERIGWAAPNRFLNYPCLAGCWLLVAGC